MRKFKPKITISNTPAFPVLTPKHILIETERGNAFCKEVNLGLDIGFILKHPEWFSEIKKK